MKLSSISQRLVLLVAVPLVALTTLAGLLINQAYTTYQNSIQTHQLMSLSVNAGNLIHTLQIERGATVGFLQSKGQKFSDVLPGLRTKTDERVALLVKDVDAIDLSQMPKLADAISKVKDTVNNVAGIRQRASDLSSLFQKAWLTILGASLN
jgi:hypothetical protein